jgi:murein DD-endopeptidase MepM/ murein hydrolase activator NlpD
MMRAARQSERGGAARLLLIALLILLVVGAYYWWSQRAPADSPPTDDPPIAEEPDGADEPAEPAPPPALTDPDGAVFSYLPVGALLPNSGPGFVDETVYRSDIVFPTVDPVYLNSQVYRYGGGMGSVNGMNGEQCDPRNYQYPWQDTFCEKRDRSQPLCPGGGHEGLDIRPHTCARNLHKAVAVEDGRIIDVRRHWVTLQTENGTIYNYLHLNMSDLDVAEGDVVAKGDEIGLISNDFFKSDGTSVPTTTHLHFEMYENYVAAAGEEPLFTKVNPYMTLVAAYDRKLRGEQ